MHETAQDLHELQAVLDRSYDTSGVHLREVITPERLLTAQQVSDTLTGMRLLVLATVTADGRPIAGPVDGIFYRGRFHFGSSPESVRFRHLATRPQVSATHLDGEELQVTVHGRARRVDVASPDHAGFRRALLDVYIPRYGKDWERFLDSGPVYACIDPERMYTFHLPVTPLTEA